MTKAFIQKRIREQLEYIDVVLISNRTDERKKEILESAAGVLKYFNELNAFADEFEDLWNVIYKATESGQEWENNSEKWRWRPSIHMPKTAARIWLEITDIKAERLRDITDADAKAEGVETLGFYPGYDVSSRGKFEGLWNLINGTESWDANPWVWVVKFKKIKK